MKKKIFGTIIFIVLLIITSLYIYIDNFEITSDDLPKKTDKKETIEAVKEDQQEIFIIDTVENLLREKHLMMSSIYKNSTNYEKVVKNEEGTTTDDKLILEVEDNTKSENESVSIAQANEKTTETSEKQTTEEKTLDDDSIEAAKDDAKTTDKAQAMALAVKRLSPEQIKRLMTISKGGFTAEEKAEALEMFYENFTEEEQEWILLKFEEYMGG